MKNMGQRVCPLGTWSFHARFGGNHAHARIAAARPAPMPTPVLARGCRFRFGPVIFWTGLHGYKSRKNLN